MIQQLHAASAGREIPLYFAVPLEAISSRKPVQKGGLLFNWQGLDLVLNARGVHIRMVPQPAALGRLTTAD